MGNVTLPPSSSAKSWGLAVAIVVGGAIVALAVYASQASRHNVTNSLSAAAPPVLEKVVVPINPTDPVIGVPTAPVTIILFSDGQCSYCNQWHRTTLASLQERYLDSGQARLVYKDFPLLEIHPQAQLAAEAGQCAHTQGNFWEYRALLAQPTATITEAMLHSYAEQLALDPAIFSRCITNHETAPQITASVQAGIAAVVTSTPTFIINGTLLEGAQPLPVLAAAIAAAQ